MSNGPWWSKWKSQRSRWARRRKLGWLTITSSCSSRDVCRDCTDKELQQSEEVVMSRVCALIRDNKLMAINLFSIWDFSSLPFRSIPFLQSNRWPFTGLPISLLTCAQTVIDKRNTILTRPGGGDTQFTALHWQYSLTYSLTLLATIRN